MKIPEFIYFVTIFNIFNEFLEDISKRCPNEATDLRKQIWGNFMIFKDALAIINKLEKFSVCILMDVDLGKTFTA